MKRWMMFLALLWVGSIQAGGVPETYALEGTEWILVSLGDEKIPETRRPVSLKLDATKKSYGGFSGVNRFGGAYELEGASLQFEPGMSTRMAGSPEVMRLENTYLATLRKVTAWRVEKGELLLLAGENVVVRLKPVGSL